MKAVRARILVLEANPLGLPRLKTTRELKNLLRELEPLGFESIIAPAVEADEIPALLLQHTPDIVHFAGHGAPDGSLVAESAEGRPAIIPMDALAETFRIFNRDHRNRLRLVVLNACYTKLQAERLSRYVEHVVAMDGAVADDGAIAFARGLYTALGNEQDLRAALEYGRNQSEYGRDQQMKRRPLPAVLLPDPPRGEDPRQARFTAQLTELHRAYLRHWFEKPWTRVALAELSDRDERVQLLDVYVPLPVDFGLAYRYGKDRRIEEWWARSERDESERADKGPEISPDEAGAEPALPKQREWPELRVGEAELQRIVERFQVKIWQRDASARENEGSTGSMFMEAHDAASVQPRFVLVGDPGSGKTAFLRHLTLCHAGELRRRGGDAGVPDRASLPALNEWLLGAYTPVYVELHDLVTKVFPSLPVDGSGDALRLPSTEHLWRYLRKTDLDGGLAGFEPELRDRLRAGEALILLDGLDEVSEAARTDRRDQIKAFVQDLDENYPQARIIVTSRPHAYRREEWNLKEFGRAELRLLSDERLAQLAEAMFESLSSETGAEEAHQLGAAQAKEFMAALRRREIPPDMRGTPLFFTLLAAMWLAPEADGVRDLPATPGALYRQAVDLLLRKWTQRVPGRKSAAEKLRCSPDELRTALERMACAVHGRSEQHGSTIVFYRKDFLDELYAVNENADMGRALDYLERKAGILSSLDELEREPGILTAPASAQFRFVHWSFQEHLAACDLISPTKAQRGGPADADRRFPDGLVGRVNAQPDLWRNVALLAADELRHQGRDRDVETLLVALLEPYVHEGKGPRSAMLALELASKHGLLRRPEPYDRQQGVLALLRAAAERGIEDPNVGVEARASAGRHLAALEDRRPGVGLCDGLPDIMKTLCWVEPGTVEIEGGVGTKRVEAAFRIARYPVTHVQYQAFVEAEDGYRDRRWWDEPLKLAERQVRPREQHWPIDNHPAEGVSWYDAMAFCRWLTSRMRAVEAIGADEEVRLPTEAEWQLAAGGLEGRAYPWGSEYEVGRANVDESREDGGVYLQRTSAVGIYPDGAVEHGEGSIHDMSGNVWEWTLSERRSDQDDLDGNHDDLTSSRPRVVRGGSWADIPSFARVASRYDRHPVNRSGSNGLRVVVAAPVSQL